MSAWDEFGLMLLRRPMFRLELIGVVILYTAIVVVICYVLWVVLLRTKKKRELYPDEAINLIAELKGEVRVAKIDAAYAKADLVRKNVALKTVQEAVSTRWFQEPLDVSVPIEND